MSASLEPLSPAEFLAWEAEQEERYEFDGIQPIAMTYAILEQATPRAIVRRRQAAWGEELVEGPGAVLDLPEVGVELPLHEVYAGLDL
jgi:hypothetical protein